MKRTRASGRNVGKVFNPVVKLVLENQPFLMPEPAEKPSLHTYIHAYIQMGDDYASQLLVSPFDSATTKCVVGGVWNRPSV